MSWMSGPMFPPVESNSEINSTVPIGSDEIAEPSDDAEQPDDEPS
jgi:hypothetical protein